MPWGEERRGLLSCFILHYVLYNLLYKSLELCFTSPCLIDVVSESLVSASWFSIIYSTKIILAFFWPSLQSQRGLHQPAAPGLGPGHRPLSPSAVSSLQAGSQKECCPLLWHFGSRLAVAQMQGSPGGKKTKIRVSLSLSSNNNIDVQPPPIRGRSS